MSKRGFRNETSFFVCIFNEKRDGVLAKVMKVGGFTEEILTK